MEITITQYENLAAVLSLLRLTFKDLSKTVLNVCDLCSELNFSVLCLHIFLLDLLHSINA